MNFAQHAERQQPQQQSPVVLAGAHPSSEGKRRRNRSNVEAMAAAQSDSAEPSERSPAPGGDYRIGQPHPLSGMAASSSNLSIPSYREDGGGAMGGLTEAELGPLPPNWEKAYTERGEVYFIE